MRGVRAAAEWRMGRGAGCECKSVEDLMERAVEKPLSQRCLLGSCASCDGSLYANAQRSETPEYMQYVGTNVN